ncbi:MAG: hypothetical protein AAGK97_04230, partial [Bacteroidota bacterium]
RSLNPTKSSYIFDEVIYVDDSDQYAMLNPPSGGDKLMMDTIEVLGFPIPGHFKQVSDMVIKGYDYGPGDVVPEQITMSGHHVTKVRVRSAKDFTEYLLQELKNYEEEEAPVGEEK